MALERSSLMFQARPATALALALIVCAFVLPSCKKPPKPDYDLYENMGDYMADKLEAAGATVRTDMPEQFAPGEDYIKRLRGLVRLVFGSRKLQVYLNSYESAKIAVGSISQFEVPPESGTYTDCAFVVRPAANIHAPIMHGDARAAMAGMDDEFSMDFYNINSDSIDIEAFFDNETATLDAALDLVKDYQIPPPPDGDRGEYTEHLEPYKSKYRLELAAPDTDNESEREAYFDACLQAFKLYQDAYFAALAKAAPDNDTAFIAEMVTATDDFITLLNEEDTAAALGKMLFGRRDFDDYFNKGFWREGYYGQGIAP